MKFDWECVIKRRFETRGEEKDDDQTGDRYDMARGAMGASRSPWIKLSSMAQWVISCEPTLLRIDSTHVLF